MFFTAGLQVDYVVAFLGVTLARAVAAPVNANYTQVSSVFRS